MEHVIIVVVSILCATFGGSYVWYIVTKKEMRERELLHAERLAALEKGLTLPGPTPAAPSDASAPLKMGIFWLSLGVGLIVALLIAAPGSTRWAWGLIVVAMGVSDLAFWLLRGRAECLEAERARQEPPASHDSTRR